MDSFNYLRPKDLKEALEMLREEGTYPLAGGTNLLVDIRAGAIRPRTVVDIGFLPELRELAHQNGSIEIGSCLNMTEIANSALIKSRIPLLAQSALSVGGPQIRNRATLGGNIVSASPAADTVVSLIALDAEATLQSVTGMRKMLLEDLFLGPGQTKIKKDELLTQISFKPPGSDEKGLFFKFGRRNAMAISVVNLAIVVTVDQMTEKWRSARIALGSVAPVVIRARKAESLVSNQQVDEALIQMVAEAAASECSPISDIRASAHYRRAMVEVHVQWVLKELVSRSP